MLGTIAVSGGARIAFEPGIVEASESRYTRRARSTMLTQRTRYTQFAAMHACTFFFNLYCLNTSTTTSSSAIHARAWVHVFLS